MQYKLWLFIGYCLLAGSCSKKLGKVDAPAFEVTVKKTTFKVGEPVLFSFKGEQDNIAFYSGEGFNDYAFKDGRVINVSGKGVALDFATQLSGTGTQTNQLSVWISGDYNGKNDLANIQAATWANITDSFTLATAATSVASGKADISSWFTPGKPVYIGFKYITKPQETNGLARSWGIQTVVVRSKAPLVLNKELLLTDQENAGFRIIDQYPKDAPSKSTIISTKISLLGNTYKQSTDSIFNPNYSLYNPANPIYNPQSPLYSPTAVIPVYVPFDPASPYNDPLTETWAISKPIYGDSVNLGPDWALSLKGINTDYLQEYVYTYKTPGTYKVYFIAWNQNIEGAQQVIRQVDLTITP
ncbi:DUF5017 domain-containing protein [Pseudoflavitalea sp. X16]|uniref:DUF5017 domain-containing protein n=1 Tax=Paraflavitalea devenefica TaxID=2716334 RepID=UPI0014231C3E|nr:DUF5017 domain-containing protein [Paraflavitalea devenefica]NII28467.1 DUF5017 domain-containing protein [Paraflavitalea devenefica]